MDKEKQIIEAILNGYESCKHIATLQEYTEEVIRKCTADIIRIKNRVTLATVIINMLVIFAALSFIDPQLIRNIIVSVTGGILFWVISMCSQAEISRRIVNRNDSVEILKRFYRKEFLKTGERAFWEK